MELYMKSIDAIIAYLDEDDKLDRGALDSHITDIQIDVDYQEQLMNEVKGKLYESERQLRLVRKVVNLYFKKESEELETDLPY